MEFGGIAGMPLRIPVKREPTIIGWIGCIYMRARLSILEVCCIKSRLKAKDRLERERGRITGMKWFQRFKKALFDPIKVDANFEMASRIETHILEST